MGIFLSSSSYGLTFEDNELKKKTNTDHSLNLILITARPCGIRVVSNWKINYKKFKTEREGLLRALHMMLGLQMCWTKKPVNTQKYG